MTQTTTSKTIWISRIMSILGILPFLGGGIYSLFSNDPKMVEGFAHYGWPASMLMVIVGIEIACAILYIIPTTSILGAILLTGYLGGAIATHLRIGENNVFLHIILGTLIWGGLFLRTPELRKIFPFYRK